MAVKKGLKVGILTFYRKNYNFGGLLQAYALPRALSEHFGADAEQIAYIHAHTEAKAESGKKTDLMQKLRGFVYNFGIFFFDKINRANLNRRKKAFETFIDEIPHSPTAYDYETIDRSLSLYQAFICGGDQIWNDYGVGKNTEVYTLKFVPSGYKKISYAPSMASFDASDNFKEIMQSGLNSLDAVSVREKKSLSVLKPLTDKDIKVVADPVLLLSEDEWSKVAREGYNKGEYILCYLLGDSVKQREAVKKLAKRLKLPILTFPHILFNAVRKCDLFFGDIHDYTSGPREFIGLIKNAKFVVTDSFHASVFAMIFEVPFALFERNKSGEKGNMNSRIHDFLEEYNLQGQLFTEKELAEIEDIPKVDFTYAQKHLTERRKDAFDYLENALGD